jgi:hypothetical protein
MFMVCGEADVEAAFDGIIGTYKMIADYQKWTDRGHLIVPGVYNKGDILTTKYLALAEEMGQNI